MMCLSHKKNPQNVDDIVIWKERENLQVINEVDGQVWRHLSQSNARAHADLFCSVSSSE